jgi:hypothetical protein
MAWDKTVTEAAAKLDVATTVGSPTSVAPNLAWRELRSSIYLLPDPRALALFQASSLPPLAAPAFLAVSASERHFACRVLLGDSALWPAHHRATNLHFTPTTQIKALTTLARVFRAFLARALQNQAAAM